MYEIVRLLMGPTIKWSLGALIECVALIKFTVDSAYNKGECPRLPANGAGTVAAEEKK